MSEISMDVKRARLDKTVTKKTQIQHLIIINMVVYFAVKRRTERDQKNTGFNQQIFVVTLQHHLAIRTEFRILFNISATLN